MKLFYISYYYYKKKEKKRKRKSQYRHIQLESTTVGKKNITGVLVHVPKIYLSCIEQKLGNLH